MGPNPIGLMSLEEIRTQAGTREDMGRPWSPMSQGQRPQKKPALSTPCEKIDFCRLSHPDCGSAGQLIQGLWEENSFPKGLTSSPWLVRGSRQFIHTFFANQKPSDINSETNGDQVRPDMTH